MIATSIQIDINKEEQIPHQNSAFPYTAFYETYNIYPADMCHGIGTKMWSSWFY